jgi:hypothetical protein
MFEILLLILKVIAVILAVYISQSLARKNYKTHPYRLAADLVVIWLAVVGFWSQEFRTRNVINQQLSPPKQEVQMKQSVYVPKTNLKTNNHSVDMEAMLEKSRQDAEARKAAFLALPDAVDTNADSTTTIVGISTTTTTAE